MSKFQVGDRVVYNGNGVTHWFGVHATVSMVARSGVEVVVDDQYAHIFEQSRINPNHVFMSYENIDMEDDNR